MDINQVIVGGKVLWQQNWKHKNVAWGGTIAMRVSLSPFSIKTKNGDTLLQNKPIFVKASYSQKDAENPYVKQRILEIEKHKPHVLIPNGTLVDEIYKEQTNYVIKCRFNDIKLLSTPIDMNKAYLVGTCASDGQLMEVHTGYRHPKENVFKFRKLKVLNQSQNFGTVHQKDKVFVAGKIATIDPGNRDNTYIVGELIA